VVGGHHLFYRHPDKPDAPPNFPRIPEDQLDVPKYVRDHRQRLEYLFDRTGPTASLLDVFIEGGIPKAMQSSVAGDRPCTKRSGVTGYRTLGPTAWPRTPWGKGCLNPAGLSLGQQAMCQLPQTWKNCTQGIYIDLVSSLDCSELTSCCSSTERKQLKLCRPWPTPCCLGR
jgi:hypothetical protein